MHGRYHLGTVLKNLGERPNTVPTIPPTFIRVLNNIDEVFAYRTTRCVQNNGAAGADNAAAGKMCKYLYFFLKTEVRRVAADKRTHVN